MSLLQRVAFVELARDCAIAVGHPSAIRCGANPHGVQGGTGYNRQKIVESRGNRPEMGNFAPFAKVSSKLPVRDVKKLLLRSGLCQILLWLSSFEPSDFFKLSRKRWNAIFITAE
jgi:hypothetical protein